MKNHQSITHFFLVAAFIFSFSGCTDQILQSTVTYTEMEPVYMSPQEIREAASVVAPEGLGQTGRIYLYENYIFVNEMGRGIHVINNSEPAEPVVESFINLPGNYKMSIKDDIMYADSYMDMVAIDISNFKSIEIAGRIQNIFSNFNQNASEFYDPELGVIVDWEIVKTIEIFSEDFMGSVPNYYPMGHTFAFRGAAEDASALSRAMVAPSGGNTGIGGSMARFTISGDFLYSVDNFRLYVFDITNLETPVNRAISDIGWGIETIFPYEDKLFIGSQTGMYIYDINNPVAPLRLSVFEHVQSCDPVVVNDTIAYVTLRGGTGCRNDFTNQLDVIDISDPTRPTLLATHLMQNPHGLGIAGNTLFICEGEFGLKIFDASDHYTISSKMITHFNGMDAFDVIPYQDILILIGQDGLYQFDYSNPEEIKLISGIPITNVPVN